MPALVTSPWTRPYRASQVGRQRRPAVGVGDVELPVLDAGESSAGSGVRSQPITVAPSAASSRASAAPCPCPAPVTTTTLPATRLTAGASGAVAGGEPGRPAAGRGPATTRLRIVPMPSTVISTTSPGCSGGRGELAARAPQLGEAAAVAAGAGAEDVAGADLGAAGGVGDQVLERPAHVGQQVLADLDAVDRHRHVEGEEAVGVAVGLELVGGDQPRARAWWRSPCPWPGRGRPSSRGAAGRGPTSR